MISEFSLISAFKDPECSQYLSPFLWSKLPLSVDLSKLNLFPDRTELFNSNGFKDSIFNSTCKYNKRFTLPNLIIDGENITYHLPDYLHVKINTQDNIESIFKHVVDHRTFEDDEENYRKNMMHLLDLNYVSQEEKEILSEFGYNTSDISNLLIGAFKLNKNYQRIRKERFANQRIPDESRINITGYLITLDDSKISLTNAFLNEINSLPLNYEDSKEKYESFLQIFGTHYFSYYVVGGLAINSFRIPIESPVQLDQLSQDQFNNNRPFAFDLEGLEFSVDENFGSNSTFFISDGKLHERVINFYGGRIEAKNHSIEKWKRSAILDPWLIGGGLSPISRLIKDKQKKRNFLRAMMAYLDKAEILNLEWTCNLLQEVNGQDKWVKKYREKIEELNQRPFINHTNLVSLSTQFNEDINVEIKRRELFNDPINTGLYSSSLDKIEKEHVNKIKNSSSTHLISFWLLTTVFFLIFQRHFI